MSVNRLFVDYWEGYTKKMEYDETKNRNSNRQIKWVIGEERSKGNREIDKSNTRLNKRTVEEKTRERKKEGEHNEETRRKSCSTTATQTGRSKGRTNSTEVQWGYCGSWRRIRNTLPVLPPPLNPKHVKQVQQKEGKAKQRKIKTQMLKD
jgi:hypothetical protein